MKKNKKFFQFKKLRFSKKYNKEIFYLFKKRIYIYIFKIYVYNKKIKKKSKK